MRNNGTVPHDANGRSNTSKKPRQPLLSKLATTIARNAINELDDGRAGRHLGVTHIKTTTATHRFAADVPGYPGWEWNVVLACARGSHWITVSELALVPGGTALKAPEWVPYQQRIQPGDLGPGDIMPAPIDDNRLTTDPDDAVTTQQHKASTSSSQPRMLSQIGLSQALQRWKAGEHGPQSPYARQATFTCATCAFYLPLAATTDVGVCANEYSADGTIVAATYGCGAHSETPQPEPLGTTAEPFDDDQTIPIDI